MKRPLLAAALVLAVFAAYAPSLSGGFLWNDSDYVTSVPLQSVHGLKRIWLEIGATQQYYPVLHSAFWIEHRIWGDAPLGYRVANVLLHALSALLLVALLRRLAVSGAWLAGFLFALHPVCVESVAWISEQKNTLSLVFYLAAALLYLGWVVDRIPSELPAVSPPGSRIARPNLTLYFSATVLFLLAVLSKTVTATLPAALLVLIWWRRGRLEWKRDLVPLLPWFVLGAAAGLFSAWVEHTYVGASGAEFALGPGARIQVAGRIAWFYLGKLFWPVGLNFFYPRWHPDPGNGVAYAGTAAGVAALILLWIFRRPARGTLVVALLFVGSLFPVIGFFNVYAFRFSFVADHFQYLACLPVLSWAAGAWARWQTGSKAAAQATAAAVLALLWTFTWRQCSMYRDPLTFYRAILDRNPSAWVAHSNLAIILESRGDVPAAQAHYAEAVRLKPDLAEAHEGLGICLAREGRLPEATAEFESAVRLEPENARSHENLGATLARAGRLDEALREHRLAIQLKPDYPEAHNNLGVVLAELNHPEDAKEQFQEALRLRPAYPEAERNLAALQAQP